MGDKKVVDPYRSYAEMFNGELAINQNPEFIWCSSTAQVGSHMGYVFPLNFGGSSCFMCTSAYSRPILYGRWA